MTPLQIEILLHYYAISEDYREGDFSAPAVRDAIDEFRHELNLLELDASDGEREYKLTRRGEFYIESLLKIPLPVSEWKIPDITNQL